MTALNTTISIIHTSQFLLRGPLYAPNVSTAGPRVPPGYCTNTAGRVQQQRVRWDLGDSEQAVAH